MDYKQSRDEYRQKVSTDVDKDYRLKMILGEDGAQQIEDRINEIDPEAVQSDIMGLSGYGGGQNKKIIAPKKEVAPPPPGPAAQGGGYTDQDIAARLMVKGIPPTPQNIAQVRAQLTGTK